MLLLSSWVENPKNRDHLRSRSVINEIETRSGVIESTFFFTPTSPNCYFSLHDKHADLNKCPFRNVLDFGVQDFVFKRCCHNLSAFRFSEKVTQNLSHLPLSTNI